MVADLRANSRLRLQPAQFLVAGFAVVIIAGSLILMIPAMSSDGQSQTWLTTLFTSTSAVCVTGLVVVDTGSAWSPLGQAVILLLIKVGGLGIMTMTTLFALLLGRRIGLRDRLMIQEATGALALSGVVRLVRHIILFSLMFELLGTILFTARFAADYPLGRAAALGLFHSISAFNNAGFSLFETSLQLYAGDLATNLIAMSLIIVGGLGFLVNLETWQKLTKRGRLSLHSRLVLRMTGILILVGTVAVLAAEWGNPATLGQLSGPQRILAAMFHAVTPRTAGFNTLATGQLLPATLLVTMVLMFIGGSPNSTAGGIKTSTLGVLLASVAATVLGRGQCEVCERRLPRDTLDKALAVAMVSLVVVASCMVLLFLTESSEPLAIAFETVSAFGTVGLSMGITPHLSVPGRLIIIALMFVGRLGPVTLALAIGLRPKRKAQFLYPEERVIVG